MLNKSLIYIYILLSLALTAGCSSDVLDMPDRFSQSGDSFTISGTLSIPDMQAVMSRGALGETEKGGLKLTILEFDLGADASHSFLTNCYQAEVVTTTAVPNGGKVTFNVTLKSAATPKVLHLLVADQYFAPTFGSEATILPALTVGGSGGETEAYWGRVEFPDGFTELDEDGFPVLLDGVREKLTDVPVIRNFSKISLTVDNSVTNFELLGFDIINIPTSGTVAPWDMNNLAFPELLNEDGVMKSYNQIQYKGYVPGAVQFRNTEAQAKSWTASSSNMRSVAVKYIYEHPYESTRRSYLIVHGRYYDSENRVWNDCFYKLDIGMPGASSMFEQYNILRNIHYKVKITQVESVGTATVSEAIDRAPFNNLSAATETASMYSISDGSNLLIVNQVNHIIVDDSEPVEILYRYFEDVTGAQKVNNSIPHPVDLEAGPVIKSFSVTPVPVVRDGVNWMQITITPNPPTPFLQTQSFAIIDNSGLGRIINLNLRTPWEYATIGNTDYTATIAPGSNNRYTTPAPQNVSADFGKELTVYFNLPNQLPETLFPLYFTIQPDKQFIENNKIGTLVVTSGPSLFEDGGIAISYIKTVTYDEYQHLYYDTEGLTNELNPGSTNVNHTIRCRFLTTTTEAGPAEIRIQNQYFKAFDLPYASVKFQRAFGID